MDSDGWLHTGDVGKWTDRGCLQIIDRKKHIFKLAQGEYVAPERIENVYVRSKYVAQCFIHGESLKSSLIGIVVPDADVLPKEVAEKLGLKDLSIEDLCKNKDVKDLITQDMLAIGKMSGLHTFEQVTIILVFINKRSLIFQVKDIHLSAVPFSIDNGLLTPTLKSKRPSLKAHYKAEIEQMYSTIS
jgi:long-chain acyl-CoA synthetase